MIVLNMQPAAVVGGLSIFMMISKVLIVKLFKIF